MRRTRLMLIVIVATGCHHAASGQGIDPPTRVGRVSDMQGTVSLFVAGATDWSPASLNYPLTTGDALWADSDARAEIHLGSSAVRIAPQTSLVFGEISDTVTQVRIDEGSIDVHVRYLSSGETYEVDTPNGVVSLLDQGHYRIDVTPDGRRTTVTVRDGSADIGEGDRDYDVQGGSSATILGSDRPPVIDAAIPIDDWERWADGRDQREDAVQSTRYVSRDMVGYEDLDDYGDWQQDPSYGAVWYPRGIPANWAPYRFGHWESVAPWGWTWIDDEPWGFAPFHYGRWASVHGRWGWVPGQARLRPVYAPALVAFVGGNGWSGSASFGSGGGVGWVPLAPGEPYVPAYHATPSYVSRLNINLGPIRVGVNLGEPDIHRVPLANRNVPGAVTAVPRDAFVRARPVESAAVPVRPADVRTAQPSTVPEASGQPIALPPRGRRPETGRGAAPAPHPPGMTAPQVAPPPPPQFRGRPRPNGREPVQQPPRPSGSPGTPPTAAPPAPPPPPPPSDAGRGNPPRPARPPGPPPAPVTPTPAPVSPPPAPPPAPHPAPPPPAPQPPPPPPTTTPPPRDRGRRGAPPPAPVPPPGQPPAPPTPPVRPDRGRQGTPPTANSTDAAKLQQQWMLERKQLLTQQSREDADLVARQQAQLKQLPAGASPAQLQKQQQAERQAQDVRHQKERDQLDQRYRKPV